MKTPALRFTVDGKHLENEAFQKQLRRDNHCDFPARSFLKHKFKSTSDCCVFNLSGVEWTEPKCLLPREFGSKPFFRSKVMITSTCYNMLIATNCRIYFFALLSFTLILVLFITMLKYNRKLSVECLRNFFKKKKLNTTEDIVKLQELYTNPAFNSKCVASTFISS